MTHNITREGNATILTQNETQFDPDYLDELTESVQKIGTTDTSALIISTSHPKIWNQGMNIGHIAKNGPDAAIRLT